LLISVSGFLLNISASPERCGAGATVLGQSPRYGNAVDSAAAARECLFPTNFATECLFECSPRLKRR